MGNVIWGRFPERVAERAAMRFTGMLALRPTSMGENPVSRSADRFKPVRRARFVLLFCALVFLGVGWWPLALFFLGSAALSFRRPK